VSPPTAGDWIRLLALDAHPEGGYYRETYRSAETISTAGGSRAISTAIYFLLPGDQVSALHRIRSDEVWHFYAGSALTLFVLHPDGRPERARLGPDAAAGERFQMLVPSGCWYGAAVDDPASWALVGGTVAPGFDFADFELGGRAALTREFPQHRAVIERLTRAERRGAQ
jgi:uncharacterized protein